MVGPLGGIRVLELGGKGPAPFAAMMLGEMGADVIRIDRVDQMGAGPLLQGGPRQDLLNRCKRSIALDLKLERARDIVRDLAARADVVIEGFRPGVAERLGLGPDDLAAVNAKLVFCRMTGWGQDGPLSAQAGHDVNYIALTGALDAIGEAGRRPQIPLNLVGDFGGGAMYLVVGALAALREAERTGRGQVVDAAIVDGVSHLLTVIYAMLDSGQWVAQRESNFLDGAAPFYRVYETADGKHMAVGAIEPQFYEELGRRLGLDLTRARQHDREAWPEQMRQLAEAFASRSQAEWVAVFDGVDACVSPVLGFDDVGESPHMRARQALVDLDGMVQPAPAPRFSRTPSAILRPPPISGEHTREILEELGLEAGSLVDAGVVGVSHARSSESASETHSP